MALIPFSRAISNRRCRVLGRSLNLRRRASQYLVRAMGNNFLPGRSGCLSKGKVGWHIGRHSVRCNDTRTTLDRITVSRPTLHRYLTDIPPMLDRRVKRHFKHLNLWPPANHRHVTTLTDITDISPIRQRHYTDSVSAEHRPIIEPLIRGKISRGLQKTRTARIKTAQKARSRLAQSAAFRGPGFWAGLL